jgi:hypothetical protein
MVQQVLHYWPFYAAFHEVSCKRMAQRMDAALAPQTALFQRALIDITWSPSSTESMRIRCTNDEQGSG